MPRPHKCRLVSELPDYECFRPDGIPVNESIVLSCDEYEVIRLVDFEQCTHAMCAKRMGISRTTVTEIYGAARYKLADCLVNGKILEIRAEIIVMLRKRQNLFLFKSKRRREMQCV